MEWLRVSEKMRRRTGKHPTAGVSGWLVSFLRLKAMLGDVPREPYALAFCDSQKKRMTRSCGFCGQVPRTCRADISEGVAAMRA
jgi:hypothetical protein